MENINQYVIVRTQNAGVFAGILSSLDLTTATATVSQARRLWYWDGAATLSELALRGVSKPQNCKFPAPVPHQLLFGVIEVIPCSEAAIKSISEVKEWSAH